MAGNGVDIRTVEELLGHSELETTAKYLHSDTRTKQSAVEKLNGLLGAQPKTPSEIAASGTENQDLWATTQVTPAANAESGQRSVR